MNTIIQNATRSNVFNRTQKLIGALTVCVGVATAFQASASLAGFSLGAAADYAVLYEGNGGHQLEINAGPNTGNIGIGGTGTAHFHNSSTVINGRVDFSAANTGQFSDSSSGTHPVNYGVGTVGSALSDINLLSSTLGSVAASGANLAISIGNGGNQIVNAADGNIVSGNSLFNVTSLSFVNGATLTINGDGLHKVVFDINFNSHFSGTIALTGGLTTDDVLFNLYGGTGFPVFDDGPTLQYAANKENLYGIFLDPNGKIQLNSAVLNGRLFGGDSSDMQIVSNGSINAPPNNNPPVPPVPEPTTFIAGALLLLPFGASTLRILRRKATA